MTAMVMRMKDGMVINGKQHKIRDLDIEQIYAATRYIGFTDNGYLEYDINNPDPRIAMVQKLREEASSSSSISVLEDKIIVDYNKLKRENAWHAASGDAKRYIELSRSHKQQGVADYLEYSKGDKDTALRWMVELLRQANAHDTDPLVAVELAKIEARLGLAGSFLIVSNGAFQYQEDPTGFDAAYQNYKD